MEKERLTWRNLRRNKCPRCNHAMQIDGILNDIIACGNEQCDFAITIGRLKEILLDMNKKAVEKTMYRQGEEVEDIKKIERLECTFCGGLHAPDMKCPGFG